MKIEHLAKIDEGRQDGAIYNGLMFCFDHTGKCLVYEMSTIINCGGDRAEKYSEFYLDTDCGITPHSNAVMFGTEFYLPGDEFPLLYSNVYNNYENSENQMKGVCNVYRLTRDGKIFSAKLVQLIEIGFTENADLWKSSVSEEDVRPYGNFTIDCYKNVFYAFTMRDKTDSTRYFAFDLPKLSDGEYDEVFKVKKVKLYPDNIREYFDCSYHHFMQGACCHGGRIYSTEGFTDSPENPPVIRIIDTVSKREEAVYRLTDYGYNVEAEMIDFYNGECYYGDDCGNIYKIIY